MGRAADNLAGLAEKAGRRAGDAVHRSQRSLHRRASELQKFIDDVEDLVQKVADTGDDEVVRVRDRLESSIDRMRSVALDGLEQAAESTRRAARATDEYVHERPWTAMGISAAAGIVIGALLCRR